MNGYLTVTQVNRIADAAVAAGLATADARDDLLSNINRGFVASLPVRGSVLDQLKSDVNELNGVPVLVGGEVPLVTWLENGVHRLRRAARPEQQLFRALLDEVAAKSRSAASDGGDPDPGLERVIHQDDLLEFSWLAGAAAVGAAVARIVVTRHEGGTVATSPGTGRPLTVGGTGWLI